MADNLYTASTYSDEGGIDRNQKTDYTANTPGTGIGRNGQSISSGLPSLGNVAAYSAITDSARAINNAAQTLLRISYSHIGVARQIARHGGKVSTAGVKGTPIDETVSNYALTNYNVSENIPSRVDFEYDYVFKIGDYFAPLTIEYDIEYSKNISDAQIMDGPEVYEVVNRKPKEINLRFDIRLNENTIQPSGPSSVHSFVESTGAITPDPIDQADYNLIGIKAVLDSLWEEQEVFRIEHYQLNNIHNVDWVLLENMRMNSRRGTKLASFTMRLRTVNMEENAIIFGQTTITPGNTAGGGETSF